MKKNDLFILIFIFWWSGILAQQEVPFIFSNDHPDLIQSGLNHRAALAFEVHQIPRNMEDWKIRRKKLRSIILEKTGADQFPDLPLDYHETKSHEINGITVKNIYFQTRPGVYATANLYIPEGEGPFPAVITMMGHSSNGRLYDCLLYTSPSPRDGLLSRMP